MTNHGRFVWSRASHGFRRALFAFSVIPCALATAAAPFDTGRNGVSTPASPSRVEPTNALGPPVSLVRAAPAPDRSGEFLRLEVDRSAAADLRDGARRRAVALPLSDDEGVALDLERFVVTSPTSRLVAMRGGAPVEMAVPEVVMFRGSVAGEPGSHAFLAVTEAGSINGYVTRATGERFVISHPAASAGRGDCDGVTVRRDDGLGTPFDLVRPCGLQIGDVRTPTATHVAGGGLSTMLGGPRVAKVAVDADSQFLGLFGGNETAAAAYVQQVIGAISDFYIRDLEVRLVLEFTRVWETGPTDFGADDINGFIDWWYAFDDPTPYNLVHLFSGRRDLGYGGIAFLADPCTGSGFGISGLLLGSFPSPVVPAHLQNWDLNVVAHEMGHNMGTGHTHDSYSPPIDRCGSSNLWAHSETMSYCHITPGGMLNIELGFSRRVRDVIYANEQSCLFADCNGNNVWDVVDILNGDSDDVNGNDVPDECEDCNNNGVLDTVEISSGAPDVDGNAIPDECEADCNGNNVPDRYETSLGLVPDANGNLVPDSCEPDCDSNGTADFVQIAADVNGIKDLDRDGVLDTACQDCDGNGVTDFIDLQRPGNVFVSDRTGGVVREYHAKSGVFIRSLGAGNLNSPRGLTFGPDRQLYVCSFGDDRVVRIDVETGSLSNFVSAGSGNLDGPAGVAFGPNGNLFVTSNGNSQVLEYDGVTGAFVRNFVASGSGGLLGPHGVAFGPNGHLFVSSTTHQVLQFNGVNGGSMGAFVAAGSGGLTHPRDLVFLPDGRLLVASSGTSAVLQYSSTGASLGVWADQIAINSPWAMAAAPDGHIHVARSSGEIRVLEFDDETALYLRSFIRGDAALLSPAGIAFRLASPLDCNTNGVLDLCDVTAATSEDCNGDQIPDECQLSDPGLDCNGNLVLDACECIPADAPQAEPVVVAKNRYLSFAPPTANCRSAIRVTLASLPAPFSAHEGEHRWVGVPAAFDDVGPGSVTAAGLSCSPAYRFWSATPILHVYGAEIVPGASYRIQAISEGCDPGAEGAYSAAIDVATHVKWADVVAPLAPSPGQPNFQDVSALVASFQDSASAPMLPMSDLYSNVPDQRVNFLDVSAAVTSFMGQPYPFPGPATCP